MRDLELGVLPGLLLIAGCVLYLGAAVGIVRFPDVVSRLHASAKPQVLGLLLLLTGLGLHVGQWSLVPVLILTWVLMLIATPVASHMVGRSGYRNRHFDPDSLSSNELEELIEEIARQEAQEQDAESAPASERNGD